MMLNAAIWCGSAVLAALFMEAWAAFLHRHVWHGVLYRIHRTHHADEHAQHQRGWQLNDLLSTVHAPIAVALILFGCLGAPGWVRELAFGAGLGITLFGVAYVVVHDGVIHGRLPLGLRIRRGWLARVKAAHLVHHNGGGGVPYGLFSGPWVLRKLKQRGVRPSLPSWPPRPAGR